MASTEERLIEWFNEEIIEGVKYHRDLDGLIEARELAKKAAKDIKHLLNTISIQQTTIDIVYAANEKLHQRIEKLYETP